jgi:cytochrome c
MTKVPGSRDLHRLVAVAVAATTFMGCREPEAHPRSVPGGIPERGQVLVATFGCGSCHQVPGVPGAVGRVGPSLADLGARSHIAGILPNDAANLVRWVRFPQQVKPGSLMPELGVSEGDAAHIAAYLYSIQPGGLGPPHVFPSDLIPAH